jgi:hypothetical protein
MMGMKDGGPEDVPSDRTWLARKLLRCFPKWRVLAQIWLVRRSAQRGARGDLLIIYWFFVILHARCACFAIRSKSLKKSCSQFFPNRQSCWSL